MLQVQGKITDALYIHDGQSEDTSCFRRRRVQSRREGRCRGTWDARAVTQERVCRARCHEVMEPRRGRGKMRSRPEEEGRTGHSLYHSFLLQTYILVAIIFTGPLAREEEKEITTRAECRSRKKSTELACSLHTRHDEMMTEARPLSSMRGQGRAPRNWVCRQWSRRSRGAPGKTDRPSRHKYRCLLVL